MFCVNHGVCAVKLQKAISIRCTGGATAEPSVGIRSIMARSLARMPSVKSVGSDHIIDSRSTIMIPTLTLCVMFLNVGQCT